MLHRRSTLMVASALAVAAGFAFAQPARADQVVKIGIDASLTGGDAHSALLVSNGAKMAIEEANASKKVKGVKFEAWVLDDGTATAGQYDPAQAAINARKFVADKSVIAEVGPQMSGAAKAMIPIASWGNLPMITESATNPAMTDPMNAAQYRPAGKPVFFRTVATDAYQGPYLANYFADVLKVKTLYVLDDSGAYGEGIAKAFEDQAVKKGIKLLGHDKLDPKAADYSAVFTKIKSLNPDALFYGGVLQAGVKVVKQAYDSIPKVVKGGGDGIIGSEMFTAAGYPAAEGWYGTQASPHVVDDAALKDWIAKYKAKYNMAPDDYTVTAYDATLVVIDTVAKLKEAGKPITRDNVRDAIHNGTFKTLQGDVGFDENGDIKDKVISVFQAHQDKACTLDDVNCNFKYIGVAPQS
ncbi:MAG: branched-chain amino acid ABC transporter substrate-binding protein [Proteobacteria bacterium]|nr:branched-chain amino acid ABC transporter substrate-binding protein [Pseudomonadota bacterium]